MIPGARLAGIPGAMKPWEHIHLEPGHCQRSMRFVGSLANTHGGVHKGGVSHHSPMIVGKVYMMQKIAYSKRFGLL